MPDFSRPIPGIGVIMPIPMKAGLNPAEAGHLVRSKAELRREIDVAVREPLVKRRVTGGEAGARGKLQRDDRDRQYPGKHQLFTFLRPENSRGAGGR